MQGKSDAVRLLDFLSDGDLNPNGRGHVRDGERGPRGFYSVGFCQALGAYAEARENDPGLL